MVLARDDVGTITFEQWTRREQADEPPVECPPPVRPRPPPVKRRSWVDELERRACRCRGCGEWIFDGPYCDWCVGRTPEWLPVAPPVSRRAIHRKSPVERVYPTGKQVSDGVVTYACCEAKRDALGRKPIGWCGPDCLRRAERVQQGADR